MYGLFLIVAIVIVIALGLCIVLWIMEKNAKIKHCVLVSETKEEEAKQKAKIEKYGKRRGAIIDIALLLIIPLLITGVVWREQARKELYLAEYKYFYLEEVMDDYLDYGDDAYISSVLNEISAQCEWAANVVYQNKRWGIFSKYWTLRGEKFEWSPFGEL